MGTQWMVAVVTVFLLTSVIKKPVLQCLDYLQRDHYTGKYKNKSSYTD